MGLAWEVARRLATKTIGVLVALSGRPCSLAEMAIPAQAMFVRATNAALAIFVRATNAALAIFVARRHATKQVACMIFR